MKFNKTLRSYVDKYKKHVNPEYWFNYKVIKKLIKKVRNYQQNDLLYIFDATEEHDNCCICLENNCLMKTFCCHNDIHHLCFVHTLAFCNSKCPLCRTPIDKAIQFDVNNEREKVDAEIIGIISQIHLNIMKIEDVCSQNKIKNEKILLRYKKINHTAVTKVCKKMNKYLHIDVKQYFMDFLNKRKIICDV